jgi:hypothetical protein
MWDPSLYRESARYGVPPSHSPYSRHAVLLEAYMERRRDRLAAECVAARLSFGGLWRAFVVFLNTCGRLAQIMAKPPPAHSHESAQHNVKRTLLPQGIRK